MNFGRAEEEAEEKRALAAQVAALTERLRAVEGSAARERDEHAAGVKQGEEECAALEAARASEARERQAAEAEVGSLRERLTDADKVRTFFAHFSHPSVSASSLC